MRLIDSDGTQLGIVPLEEARRAAGDQNLDLVEVSPGADPPVVRILDWGKLKYEKERAARESRKKAHVIEVKEIKYRPGIDTHDFARKTERAVRFLEKGKKVKVTIFFRYRQLRRPDLGGEIMDKVLAEVGDLGTLESRSELDGRRMVMVIAPTDLGEREKKTRTATTPAKGATPEPATTSAKAAKKAAAKKPAAAKKAATAKKAAVKAAEGAAGGTRKKATS